MMKAECMATPTAMLGKLPEGVEVVRIMGRWWLITWTAEHVVATPDPDKWLYKGNELSPPHEIWIPPVQHVAELAADLAAETNGGLGHSGHSRPDPWRG